MTEELEQCVYLEEGKCSLGPEHECTCSEFIKFIDWLRGETK